MPHKSLVALAAAAITVTAFSVLPADARVKNEKQSGEQPPSLDSRTQPPSLDGRTTGRARTCWHDTFVYDSRGGPTGPYCH